MGKSSSKRGMLVFKGEDPKKKTKKKAKHDTSVGSTTQSSSGGHASSSLESIHSKAPSASAAAQVKMMTGTGLITSSGTVVTGHGTVFMKELAAGDAIVITTPHEAAQQMRVVTMRLSDISLNVSSAFASSLKTPIAFQYIRKPRDEAKLQQQQEEAQTISKKEQEERASGTYGSTEALVYRERTETGNYRIRTQKIQNVSRSEMLQMRAKKTSDKYC